MKKILIWGVILVVVVVIVGVAGVMLTLDSTIKKGVETIGPRLTKSEVKLDGVTLSIFSGSGSINGLLVGNPEGFKTPEAIKVGRTTVELEPRSLFSDKVVVRKIEVIEPEVTVEGGLGGINLSKLLENVQEATGGSGTNAGATPKDPAAEAGKKLQVDSFLISKAKVKVGLTQLGGQGTEVTLEDIHLTNLGSGPEGITAAELTEIALATLTKETLKVVSNQLQTNPEVTKKVSEITGLSTNEVNAIGKGISDLLKKK